MRTFQELRDRATAHFERARSGRPSVADELLLSAISLICSDISKRAAEAVELEAAIEASKAEVVAMKAEEQRDLETMAALLDGMERSSLEPMLSEMNRCAIGRTHHVRPEA